MAVSPRVPTLKDVAELAGVHVATASRALSNAQSHLVNEATREKVSSAAAELGYRTNALARSLRRGASGTLGVVVADLANPFIVNLVRGIEQETRPKDLLPLIVETRDDPARLRSTVQQLLYSRVDAIILAAAHLSDAEYVADLAGQLPVVLAVRGFDEQGPTGGSLLEVMQDDLLGTRAAVEHLLHLGHRRLAEIRGPQTISSFANRSRGFQEAIAAWPGAEDLSPGLYAAQGDVSEGRRIAAELLAIPHDSRPTAIFAHNDLLAVGALEALRDAGLSCPEDLSIVGYNDAPLVDHLDPPLTTVRLPSNEIGRQSARLAIAAIDGQTGAAPTRLMLLPEFVQRGSTRSFAEAA
ncbi:LacI family DNA-binding transcriptional regulator [Leucobacter weissii]|uniref:LacI family DNA-binding transcriptional regulator n=1 Tax=Leucobacter weissii TaxID=1983706 RepID=A0A939SA40_9MICO|nr:LacI family DNA-binding transcriptional regulator [Leucobacter weissii]MBO1901557.1 LacI family DNA-binding transcriptional regulator [Leucobacter weissii]